MKKQIMTFLKKRWLLIWMTLAAVMSLNMIVAFADYPTALPSMKRVAISTSTERGAMFSSNILIENGSHYYSAQYKSALNSTQIAGGGNYSVDVYFWNYSLKDIYSKYSQDIPYTLSFQFVNTKGEALTAADLAAAEPAENPTVNDVRTITVRDQENHSVTFSKTCLNSTQLSEDDQAILSQMLTHDDNDISTNSLTLEFSGNWDLVNDTNICLQVIADVDQTAHPNLSDLGAIIGLKRVSDSNISGWYAYLSEHRDSNDTRAASGFDGFNLVLEGSGAATITVTIDTTKFGINKYFYGTVEVTDTITTIVDEGTENEHTVVTTKTRQVHFDEVSYVSAKGVLTMTINANSNDPDNDYRNRYNIQIYKKGTDEAETAASNWNFFSVCRGSAEKPGTKPEGWENAGVKVEIIN